ncbi:MAG: RES domain-containing protein [Pedobacter sp.]|nr:RES domain-containing protein [Pedobacter sp.]
MTLMTPLPGGLGNQQILAWRLDNARHATTWDSGEGAFQFGGRWNSRKRRAVYCSIDPSTAILEVAVHKQFRTLDTVAHIITALEVNSVADIHVVQPGDVPNPGWLRPGIPSAGQQAFGDALLEKHAFIVIPSSVSGSSWNLVFNPDNARGKYRLHTQQTFALDTRLHPPAN